MPKPKLLLSAGYRSKRAVIVRVEIGSLAAQSEKSQRIMGPDGSWGERGGGVWARRVSRDPRRDRRFLIHSDLRQLC